MATETKHVLPPDRIVVERGRVVRLEKWTDWNLFFALTMIVVREGDKFSLSLFDPAHGGGIDRLQATDPLGFHRGGTLQLKVAADLSALFGFQNPTEEQIRAHHYRKGEGLQVIFQ